MMPNHPKLNGMRLLPGDLIKYDCDTHTVLLVLSVMPSADDSDLEHGMPNAAIQYLELDQHGASLRFAGRMQFDDFPCMLVRSRACSVPA